MEGASPVQAWVPRNVSRTPPPSGGGVGSLAWGLLEKEEMRKRGNEGAPGTEPGLAGEGQLGRGKVGVLGPQRSRDLGAWGLRAEGPGVCKTWGLGVAPAPPLGRAQLWLCQFPPWLRELGRGQGHTSGVPPWPPAAPGSQAGPHLSAQRPPRLPGMASMEKPGLPRHFGRPPETSRDTQKTFKIPPSPRGTQRPSETLGTRRQSQQPREKERPSRGLPAQGHQLVVPPVSHPHSTPLAPSPALGCEAPPHGLGQGSAPRALCLIRSGLPCPPSCPGLSHLPGISPSPHP